MGGDDAPVTMLRAHEFEHRKRVERLRTSYSGVLASRVMKTLFASASRGTASFVLLAAVGVAGCSGAYERSDEYGNVDSVGQALAGDDISEAFATFQAQVSLFRLDTPFRI